jgi:hypothetical protein
MAAKRGPKGPQFLGDELVLLAALWFRRERGLGRNAAVRAAATHFDDARKRELPRSGKYGVVNMYAKDRTRVHRTAADQNAADRRKHLRRLYDRLAGRSLEEFADASEWCAERRTLRGHQVHDQHEILLRVKGVPPPFAGETTTFVFIRKN